MVIDDYAHHPVEIIATLSASKDLNKKRIVAIFQPHRYTRTRDLFNDFLSAFALADLLFITDIYPAGEDPIPGVTSDVLFEGIKKQGTTEVYYIPNREKLAAAILQFLRRGDIVITLGAGNIWETSETLAETLRNRAQ